MTEGSWLQQFETTRTTVTLPTRLLERAQAVVDRGLVPSRSAAIAVALDTFLNELERREIDEAFAAMADDGDYRRLNEAVSEAFAESDWEAIQQDNA